MILRKRYILRKKHPTVFWGKIRAHCGSCSIILSIFIKHQYSLIRSVWISSFMIIYLVLDRLQCASLRLIVMYIFSRGVELNVEKSSTQNTVQQPKNNNISTRWWFWIFYSPRKIGEDSQFDQLFFSDGLNPPTRVYQCLGCFFHSGAKASRVKRFASPPVPNRSYTFGKKKRSLALLTKYTDFV